MAAQTPRWRLPALLLVAVALTTGCNLPALTYFLMPGADPKYPAELVKLASDEKGKEVKVVILASAPVETGMEFIRVDRELSSVLARSLQQNYKESKEKVVIVSPRKVEKFKDQHADWQTLGLADIGRHFDADYVIYLEVRHIGLYERGSGRLMFRGTANVQVAVVDLHETDEDPLTKEYVGTYPTGAKGPVPVDDTNLPKFRQDFMEHIAKQLTNYFVPHTASDRLPCD
jgi:hypothetical protein